MDSIKNTGKGFEVLTQEIFQAILDYDDPKQKTIAVEQNKILKGKSGVTHQIDVYWAFERAGIKYQTLVEVKDWKSKVKQDQIQSFHSVLLDIPGQPTGIFVSKNGFQRGAELYARTNGISLAVIKQGISNDINFSHIFVDHYHTSAIAFIAQFPEQQDAISRCCCGEAVFDNNVFLITPHGERILASEFIEKAEEEHQQRNSQIISGQWFLHCDFLGEWKIMYGENGQAYAVTGFDAHYALIQSKIPFALTVSNIPRYIVTYVTGVRKIALYLS